MTKNISKTRDFILATTDPKVDSNVIDLTIDDMSDEELNEDEEEEEKQAIPNRPKPIAVSATLFNKQFHRPSETWNPMPCIDEDDEVSD